MFLNLACVVCLLILQRFDSCARKGLILQRIQPARQTLPSFDAAETSSAQISSAFATTAIGDLLGSGKVFSVFFFQKTLKRYK